MKILLPTDFSQQSNVAIKYVLDFSKEIDIELILLHVADTNSTMGTRLSSKKLIEAIKTRSEKEMKELVMSIKKENNHDFNISNKIVFGSSIKEEVEAFALKNDIDIIFIGTKGASGIKKIAIGSNAASIIESSPIPVITIPEHAKFRGLKHIIYATDLSNIDLEIGYVIAIANLFDAWIHIVNVVSSQIKAKAVVRQLQKEIKKSSDYSKIKVNILVNDDVVEGISDYVANFDADMLAMFTHKLSFMEKLLGKGFTRDVAFEGLIPLFTLNKENL